MSINMVKQLENGREVVYPVQSHDLDEIEYLQIFNEFVEQNIILSRYEEQVWEIRTYIYSKNVIFINFKLSLQCRRWEHHIKYLVLLYLRQKLNPRSFKLGIDILVKVINTTWGLEDPEAARGIIASVPENSFSSVQARLLDFLDFVTIEESTKRIILQIIDSKGKILIKQRVLPFLNDIVQFNHCIEQFIDEWDDAERMKFYPVVLWWKLSIILPMRVTEFCIIPLDCIRRKDSEALFLKPQIKIKYAHMQGVKIREVPFNSDELLSLVEDYQLLTQSNSDREFLLCYNTYVAFKGERKSGANSKNNVITSHIFRCLLDDFYNEIYYKKYRYSNVPLDRGDPQRMRPGDTRHLAICNMMFMGFSPISIRNIAGHESIDAQNPYAARMDLYAQSRVVQLTEVYRKSVRQLWSGNTQNLNLVPEELRDRRIFSKEFFKYLWENKHGSYCFYTPMDCPTDDCRYCKYLYIPKESWKEALPWLAEESDQLEKSILSIVEAMKPLRKLISQEDELKNRAGELDALVNKKAQVDAYQLEIERNIWEREYRNRIDELVFEDEEA
ncbi:hypothetical protein [Paenibacillus pedocola]|uniref:hypothetical protein n=1 Tax=Paenibacillus pedocola TaxID=3242193 RepID=UPI002877527B|nr:hypothetical protein [Paenibacillus typhae]